MGLYTNMCTMRPTHAHKYKHNTTLSITNTTSCTPHTTCSFTHQPPPKRKQRHASTHPTHTTLSLPQPKTEKPQGTVLRGQNPQGARPRTEAAAPVHAHQHRYVARFTVTPPIIHTHRHTHIYISTHTVARFTWNVVPIAVSLTSFAVYVLMGHELTAATAFTSIALFNVLRFPLAMFPQVGVLLRIFMSVCW